MNRILQILSTNSKIGDNIILKVKDMNYSFHCTIESFDDNYLIVSTKNQPFIAIKGENIEYVKRVKNYELKHGISQTPTQKGTNKKASSSTILPKGEKINQKPSNALKETKTSKPELKKKTR